MTTYDTYKPSGIDWIGDIPEHWKVKRLKYCISINDETLSETTDEDFEINYVEIGDVNYLTGISNFTTYSFKEAPSRARRIVKDGDVIVSTVRTYLKAISTVKIPIENLIVSTGFAVLRRKSIESGFLGYFTLSPFFINETISNSVGVSYPAINSSYIGEFLIALPDKNEQTVIATYLDRKTAEIDHIIANKQKLIALYEEEKQTIINQAVTRGVDKTVKLKPSGVEWLGDIPEQWEVMKLKWISKVRYGLGQPPKEKSDGLPIIRATNVFRGRIDTNNLVFVDPDDVPYDRDPILKENDIIVVRSGAYTADSTIIPKEFEGSVTGYDMVVRCDSKVNPVFISKCLLSNYVLKMQLLAHTLRAAQPHLNREELNETIILFPPFVEQQTIVAHIETECSRLDTLIEKFKKQIELFQEYRTTLISEVVTGKVKVY